MFVLVVSPMFSCESFLDERPDKSLVVPSTLEDFQTLLDNEVGVMNHGPALGLISSDEYYTSYQGWQGFITAIERNGYIWKKEIYEGFGGADWKVPYESVFYSNIVLEGLEKVTINEENQAWWNRLRGSALFYRSFAFYGLLDIYAPVYDPSSAATDWGIPIRLTADVNAPVFRESVDNGYRQIIEDLEEASNLLPERPDYLTRPSATACDALLARVYLVMGDYEQALQAAERSLGKMNDLIDYNLLDETAARPITGENVEVIFRNRMVSYSFANSPLVYVDPNIIGLYHENDLRKDIFFEKRGEGKYSFRGTYTGDLGLFSGLTTAELLLVKAECEVRAGKIIKANEALNQLLEKRYREGSFFPLDIQEEDDLLDQVFAERRKELVFRGSRWTDLRRLNKSGDLSETLTRELDGQVYTLPPNDPRYVLPIPPEEINVADIPQNPR